MAEAQLAIDGGRPVRATPVPSDFIGTRWVGEEEKTEVLAVLERRALSRVSGMEPPTRVVAFEREIAHLLQCRFALGVTSGTAALEVALGALGIGPGDEVIMPAVNFISSPEAALRLGAVPVFAEVDEGFGIDPDDVARRITPRTRAIMPLHVHGAACRIDAICQLARTHDLLVLENAAWSCGATFQGQSVGTFGDAGIFSLQSVKVLTAGEGGVVITGDPVVYERAVRYHDHGNFRAPTIPPSLAEGDDPQQATGTAPVLEPFIGAAFRMNELTAAVALAQARKLERLLAHTRATQQAIIAGLRDLLDGQAPGPLPFVLREVPDPSGDCGIAVGLIFPETERAKEYQAALRAEGVPLSWLYGARPVYTLPQMQTLRPVWTNGAPLLPTPSQPAYPPGTCPRTEDLLSRVLMLSVTPDYTEEDVRDVALAFQKVTRHLG